MGMYTELVLKCEINPKAPKEVLEVLCYLFDGGPEPWKLPSHKFFKCSRWSAIGRGASFYHHPVCVNSWYANEEDSYIYLFSRSDLKNYANEIEHFMDWVNPYIAEEPGTVIGWKWYEEDVEPTLLRKEEDL